MSEKKLFKVRTKFVATRGVKEYRETIPQLVGKDDVVLEVGCEWGTTTALIAPHCKEVIGIDISAECIEKARQHHPEIRFEAIDGYDILSIQRLGKRFTKIYIDMSGLSGYRSLLDLISLLTMYATVLQPEIIVVKSSALKHFASLCIPWGKKYFSASE